MAKKWNNLMAGLSPARRRRIERAVRQDLTEMLLAEVRRLAGLSQEDLAGAMGVTQATISQMEHQDDMQISTLRRIVEALGGQLEIVANLPAGRISICQFKDRGDAA